MNYPRGCRLINSMQSVAFLVVALAALHVSAQHDSHDDSPATLPPTTAAKCEEVRADIVFVIDTTTPTKTSLKLAGCNPINPIRAFASRMVREIESVISKDEVRVAAITFGKCAH